jgi:hypothetical protein
MYPPALPSALPGDSHTCALTELGAVWAWGTYRDGSGVMGFAKHTRIQVGLRAASKCFLPYVYELSCCSTSWVYMSAYKSLYTQLDTHPTPRQHSQLVPTCVYTPSKAEDQIVRIASGG